MARRRASLKPQLNQIRTWAAEGRTDVWIAHALETTAPVIAAFRAEHGLGRNIAASSLEPVTPESLVLELDAADARARERAAEAPEDEPAAAPAEDAAEDAAPVAAPRRRSRRAAAEKPAAEPTPAPGSEPTPNKRRRRSRGGSEPAAPAAVTGPSMPEAEHDAEEASAEPTSRRRRRRRRGGRQMTATFVAGPVIALDASVLDDVAYREHWAGSHGLVIAEVTAETLVLRRVEHGAPDA